MYLSFPFDIRENMLRCTFLKNMLTQEFTIEFFTIEFTESMIH